MAETGRVGYSPVIEVETGYMKLYIDMDLPIKLLRHTKGMGLALTDCYIGATVRCAPPGNKPLPDEFDRCSRFLYEEIHLLKNHRVVIALGKIGFDHYLKTCRAHGRAIPAPIPKFGHGVSYRLPWGVTLLGSYHPSQQNTFTGKLTRPMFHAVFQRARKALEGP